MKKVLKCYSFKLGWNVYCDSIWLKLDSLVPNCTHSFRSEIRFCFYPSI